MQHAFPSGTRALDLVGTLRARSEPAPAEHLREPADLAAWFRESGLATGRMEVDDRDLADAIELREAIWALVRARLDGTSLPRRALAVVNARAAEPPLTPTLVGGRLERRGTAAGALADLAREAVGILDDDHAPLLRECARPGCTQVYLDTSRGHRREWCSMATCGSRVKAAAYRARKAAAS